MTHKTNSRLAGFVFLFYIVSGIGGMILFAPATAGHTTAEKLASVAQHQAMIRAEGVYALLMAMNAIVLAVAIYGLTRDYDRDLALLALCCRMIEGGIAVVGALLTRALLTASTDVAAAIFSLNGFTALISATLFAIGSTIYCWLFLRARSIPASLAWLGVLSSVLLLIALPLQIAGVLSGTITYVVWIPVALFEITFAFWLLIKGV